jgi:uncharacterized protein
MLNYAVEPGLLNRYVPPGTVLDSFEGRTYLSLVGFRFCHTKLLGHFALPFHADFDEVNLRFYVRRKNSSGDRRGVVFISEVVPKRAIALAARIVYGENYTSLPMRHSIQASALGTTAQYQYEYQWKTGSQWCKLAAQTVGDPSRPGEGSMEQFITEHYWGYSTRHSGGCLEYQVSHPPWQVWATAQARFDGEASTLYGSDLGSVLQLQPAGAFVADGSPVIVYKGDRI